MTTATIVLLLLLSIFTIGIKSGGVVKEYQDEVPGEGNETVLLLLFKVFKTI